MSLSGVAAEIARLKAYNAGAVSPANPFGLAAGGHVDNFPQACRDLALVAGEVAEEIEVFAYNTAPGNVFAPAWRNRLINGGFQVAQRGNGPHTSGWGIDGATAHVPHSRVGLAPGELEGLVFAAEFTMPATSGTVTSFFVEDAAALSGGPVVVSAWVRAAANQQVRFWAAQLFGTGGSSPVYVSTPAFQTATTVWTRMSWVLTMPSAAGKTVGPGHHVRIYVEKPAGGGGQLWLAGVQVERGTVASPFEARPYSVDKILCSRFLRSTYPDGIGPGALTAEGALRAQASSATALMFDWRFETPMRAAPSVTTFRPDAAGSGTSASPASAAVSVARVDADGLSLTANAGLTAGNVYSIHALLRAEY